MVTKENSSIRDSELKSDNHNQIQDFLFLDILSLTSAIPSLLTHDEIPDLFLFIRLFQVE